MQRFIIALSLVACGCNTINPIKNIIKEQPPYTKYIRSLESADLDKTAMVKSWIAAGEFALHDSVIVDLPYSESGYFKASEPEARSYRFHAREGQVLTVDGAVTTKTKTKIFLNLFVWKDSTWTDLAHADSTFNLAYEFNEDYNCLLRIQPELLVDVYYTLGLSLTPVLINPVLGANNKSIGSFYGASRDGGKRTHEGVDIFAKKGTPVIAPAAGYISRVGASKLGGSVVWMQDMKRGHSYYFAHLDKQLVRTGNKVKRGDTLGTVGNTGNARFTPPHLHFGIYQSRSKDPINYIKTLETIVSALPWDTTFQQPAFKVIGKRIHLRAGPGDKYLLNGTLKKDAFVKVIGQSNEWYRISLPNKKQGFVSKKLIAPIEKGKKLKLKQPVVLLSETTDNAVPIGRIETQAAVFVLANFENYLYVKTKDGLVGWLTL